ncbi:hypothetical protein HDV00_006017 [Rhizophlyctis rosea]|nr:hypothetical protein HDV00_006017 [Rhizophlyctis rosea]
MAPQYADGSVLFGVDRNTVGMKPLISLGTINPKQLVVDASGATITVIQASPSSKPTDPIHEVLTKYSLKGTLLWSRPLTPLLNSSTILPTTNRSLLSASKSHIYVALNTRQQRTYYDYILLETTIARIDPSTGAQVGPLYHLPENLIHPAAIDDETHHYTKMYVLSNSTTNNDRIVLGDHYSNTIDEDSDDESFEYGTRILTAVLDFNNVTRSAAFETLRYRQEDQDRRWERSWERVGFDEDWKDYVVSVGFWEWIDGDRRWKSHRVFERFDTREFSV